MVAFRQGGSIYRRKPKPFPIGSARTGLCVPASIASLVLREDQGNFLEEEDASRDSYMGESF